MSEYLSKKAVLDWHKERIEHWKQFRKTFKDGSHSLNETCEVRIDTHQVAINLIQSGAFDVTLKGVEEYYSLQYKHGQAQQEIQRLRAALERIKKWADDPEPVTMLKIWNLANETLKGDGNDA